MDIENDVYRVFISGYYSGDKFMKKVKQFSLITLSIIMVAMVSLLPALRVFAKNPAEIISTYYVDETNEMRVYLINAESKDDIASVELAGEEISDFSFLTGLEAGEGIRTTVMVDNSVSIPPSSRIMEKNVNSKEKER